MSIAYPTLPGPNTITAEMLQAGAVTEPKLGAEAVTTAKLHTAAATAIKRSPETAYGALTERATGSELEASAIEPVWLKIVAVSATATRTFLQLIVGGIIVDQASVSVAATGTGHLQLGGEVPAGKKYEVKVIEGTLEPAGKFFEVRHAS